MLGMGSELGFSQGGNNNAYAQDNATSAIDWRAADASLIAFTTRLIAVRRANAALSRDAFDRVAIRLEPTPRRRMARRQWAGMTQRRRTIRRATFSLRSSPRLKKRRRRSSGGGNEPLNARRECAPALAAPRDGVGPSSTRMIQQRLSAGSRSPTSSPASSARVACPSPRRERRAAALIPERPASKRSASSQARPGLRRNGRTSAANARLFRRRPRSRFCRRSVSKR